MMLSCQVRIPSVELQPLVEIANLIYVYVVASLAFIWAGLGVPGGMLGPTRPPFIQTGSPVWVWCPT